MLPSHINCVAWTVKLSVLTDLYTLVPQVSGKFKKPNGKFNVIHNPAVGEIDLPFNAERADIFALALSLHNLQDSIFFGPLNGPEMKFKYHGS
jgi:hypothetical protein